MKLFIFSRIICLILFFIMLTCKIKILGSEHIKKLEDEGSNWIFSLWHNNVISLLWAIKKYRPYGLASMSKDGEITTSIMSLLGFKLIRGSSSKGGTVALINMIKQIKKGNKGAITPDGSRGPKYKLQPGIIIIGKKTGVPIVPCHAECSKQWLFTKSWDQHKFPKPFSTIYVSYGEPYSVAKGVKNEDFNQEIKNLEKRMNDNIITTENFKQGDVT